LRLKTSRLAVAVAAALVALMTVALAVAAAPQQMGFDSGAKVRVLAPTSQATVRQNAVSTAVSITHFRLNCALAGTANRKGVGHYHIELDHSLINMFCAKRTSVSMLNVGAGKHTLIFLPAANDHAEDKKAEKKVSFVYKPTRALPRAKPLSFPGKPSVRIVSPKNGATVHGGFDFTVAVKNFRLSCALYGKAPVKGYGHWHANVDTTSKGMMGMGTMLGMSCAKTFHVSLAGIKPGKHRFIAILENNLHAPTIGTQATVNVTVR
jgi:hypothetical protein